MGQKCSCLYSKDEPEAYIFKDKESNTTSNIITNAHYSNFSQVKKSNSNVSVLKLKEEDNLEKELMLKSLIKFQSLCRNKIANKNFKKAKNKLQQNTQKIYDDYLQILKTDEKSEIEINYPFNKLNWSEFYKEDEKEALIFKQTEKDLKMFTKIKIYDDSSFYTGQVNAENEPHGFGSEYNIDGQKLTGQWINSKFTGYGRIIDKDNTIKEGRYVNSLLQGKGKEIKADNTIYIGDFKNNLKEGRGIEESQETKYTGLYSNDIKYGFGKLIFKLKNESYEGMFENNAINGTGTYIWANQTIYKGSFKEGKMHGFGHYLWPDGGEYKGEYENNIKEGFGWFKWANGRIYDGPFVDGKPHGIGNLTVNNKTVEVQFVDGKINKSYKIKKKVTENSFK